MLGRSEKPRTATAALGSHRRGPRSSGLPRRVWEGKPCSAALLCSTASQGRERRLLCSVQSSVWGFPTGGEHAFGVLGAGRLPLCQPRLDVFAAELSPGFCYRSQQPPPCPFCSPGRGGSPFQRNTEAGVGRGGSNPAAGMPRPGYELRAPGSWHGACRGGGEIAAEWKSPSFLNFILLFFFP